MKDSVRITKTKRGGIRIRATGKAADRLFRMLAAEVDEKRPPVEKDESASPQSDPKGVE